MWILISRIYVKSWVNEENFPSNCQFFDTNCLHNNQPSLQRWKWIAIRGDEEGSEPSHWVTIVTTSWCFCHNFFIASLYGTLIVASVSLKNWIKWKLFPPEITRETSRGNWMIIILFRLIITFDKISFSLFNGYSFQKVLIEGGEHFLLTLFLYSIAKLKKFFY